MSNISPLLNHAIHARNDGRYEVALRILTGIFDQAGCVDAGPLPSHFITMFEWSQLIKQYAPARVAMRIRRDEQARRLLDGDQRFGPGGERWPASRFGVVVRFNETLQDHHARYRLFLQLETRHPGLASREAWRVLPAVVAAGDFVRAGRYLDDPMMRLEKVNDIGRALPLFPPKGGAPRLAGELANLMQLVSLNDATLRGQGRTAEAQEMRRAVIDGLFSHQLRAIAEREMADPGTIFREMTDYQLSFQPQDLPE